MLRAFFFISILFFFSSSVWSKTIVTGRVTDTNGKPIPVVNIFLTYPSSNNPVKNVQAQKDGKYKIEINSEGLWVLHFTGIFHHPYPIAIYNNKSQDIKINVKLRTYDYNNKFSSAKIIGNFNEWSEAKGVSLKKEGDGIYSTIVDSKSDTVIYQLINVRSGGKVEGTDADGYISNGVDPEEIDGYNSFLIRKKGKVKIVFDPHKLVHSDHFSQFEITPSGSFVSGFAHAYATLEDTRQKYKSSLYSHLAEFRWNFKFDFAPYIDSVKSLLGNEPDSLIRQVLRLSFFGLKYMAVLGHYVDSKTSRETLNGIPPGSVIWSLEPAFISKALNLAAYSELEKDKYVRKVLDSNPMRRTKEILLRDEIDRKFHSLQNNEILPYLSILLDQYGDSPEAIHDREIYSRYIKLNVDDKAPGFYISSLLDSAKHFTNNSFEGKYLLLNFWSPSSSASFDEIKHLKKEYEKYRRDHFNILSIAIDSSKDDVSDFMKKRIEMPWYNAIEEHGFASPLCSEFEVYSVPKSILINPKGDIAAAGWELRGSNLIKTLMKNLGK